MKKHHVFVLWATILSLLFTSLAEARPSGFVTSNESFAGGMRAGHRASKQRGWSPAWIVGLKGWWVADVGVTVSGGKATAWADQSGNGSNLAQGNASLQPTFNSSDGSYASHASLSYVNASAQRLVLASFSVAQPCSVLVVGENDATAVNVPGFIDSTTGAGLALYSTQTNAFAAMNAGNAITSSTAVTSKSAIAGLYSGVSSSLYVNGSTSTAATGNAGTAGVAAIAVGGTGCCNVNPLTGKIVEVLVVNVLIDVYARGRWMTYESNRYGGTWK